MSLTASRTMSGEVEKEPFVFLGGPACGRVDVLEDVEILAEALFSVNGEGDGAYHRTEETDSKGRTIFKFIYLT